MNPLSRLLAGLLGILALVGAFFFGIFVLAFAVAAGLVAWLVIWIRMRWIRRKLLRDGYRPDTAQRGQPGGDARPPGRKGDVIDAEYEVVSRSEED